MKKNKDDILAARVMPGLAGPHLAPPVRWIWILMTSSVVVMHVVRFQVL